MSRPWLALVLILFCLPLFVGLKSLDLETDEAIYSFAVDRMLEDGEWLEPKSSPSDTIVFLEKPPLKFWIVAAPIAAGLLPHDEFGLRFWDALFGAAAFLYVFAIGVRLAGPVCGAVAVLLLFLHRPLVFEHGLRTNNMEGALFLCYCGGIYHFLAWSSSDDRQTRHAVAAGLLFVLGFLTKFVAAVFLPLVLALSVALIPSGRNRLRTAWQGWAIAASVAGALIVPWFVFAQIRFGNLVWETMLAEHVYARFTTALNRLHVQPWTYYLETMWREFGESGLAWIVPAGLALLGVQSFRRRWLDGTTVCLWAIVPLALISMGSSKLYHYAYPFIPPFALAAGYLVALTMQLAPVVLRKLLERVDDAVLHATPWLSAAASRVWVRAAGGVVFWAAAVAIFWTIVFGQIRLSFAGTMLLRSTGIVRPMIALGLAAIVTRRMQQASVLVIALLLASWMPVSAYRTSLKMLVTERHPMRDARDCVQRVQESLDSSAPPGLYVDSNGEMWHPITYYFRPIRPWTVQSTPSAESLDRFLNDARSFRPSLVQEERYHAYTSGPDGTRFARGMSPPMIPLLEYVLLLPGPYRVCSPESRLQLAP